MHLWYYGPMKIGVMGAVGSFSEQAAQQYIMQAAITAEEIRPLIEIHAVLAAVTADAIDLGVFAVHNSLSGIVHSTMHGMAKYTFSIVDFLEVEINQNLLVLPGTNAAQIEKIVSQRPAIEQCQHYLNRSWAGVPLEHYVDTAQAAADLATGVLPPTTAVIASARCADIYGLEILEPSIHDLKHNLTTFVVVQK